MEIDILSKTSEKIIFSLKRSGSQTAQDLSKAMGITAVAVRQHMSTLERQGYITHVDKKQSVGRPLRFYQVTDKASRFFPDAHRDLAIELLRTIREEQGQEWLEGFFRRLFRRTATDYKRLIDETLPLQKRVAAVADLRKGDGYMAEAKPCKSGGFLIVEHNSPISEASLYFVGLIEFERELYQTVLGPGVAVRVASPHETGETHLAFEVRPAS